MNAHLGFGQRLILPFLVGVLFFTGFLVFRYNPELMGTESFYSVLSESSDDNDIAVKTKLFDASMAGLSKSEAAGSGEAAKKASTQKYGHDFVVDENFHKASLGDEKGDWQFSSDLVISHTSHSLKVFDLDGNLKWSFNAPATASAPATFVKGAWPIYGHSLVVATEQGPLYAFDLTSGRLVWHTRTENKYFLAPIIAGENLLLFGELPGGQKWTLTPMSLKTLEAKEPIGPYELPLAGLPLRTEGELVFATQTGHLTAIDLETLATKPKWTAVGSSGFRNSPTELNDRIYIGNEDGGVVVYDKRNGKKLSEIELGSILQVALKIKESAGMGASIDTTGNLVAFDSRSTKRLWKYSLGSSASTLPVELIQLTNHSLHKLNFNSDLRGWAVWAPCQNTHICVFDLKKGGLLHRIDLKGTMATRFAFSGDALWADVKDKDGIWLKKYVARAQSEGGEKKP